MHRSLIIIILSVFTFHLTAQEFTKAEDSDPAAKKVLDEMRKKYEAYNTLEAAFIISIEVPEQPVSTQKGNLVQQGEKYRLSLDDRTLVSDGESIWLYLKENKEVQINNVEEGEEGTLTSPQSLLKAYEWNNHVYVLVNEFSENGRVIQQIEFKPTSRDSDYSKIRLTVDKNTRDIVRIKSFSKDGSRFTVTIDKFRPNVPVSAETFKFSKNECPDCYFEDLRI